MLIFLLYTLFFCIFYWLSGYDVLKSRYLSLNSCFYKSNTWANDFFTPMVKTKGNYLALAGAALSFAGMAYLVLAWKRLKAEPITIPVYTKSNLNKQWGWYLAVFVLAILMGISRYNRSAPAYDEIFSAVNCAELPAFQIISYYMLPNNHMYFNLINHVFLGWMEDTVTSGRLISFVAYIAILFCVFHWLCYLIRKQWLAFIALLPIALQFVTWGFAMQARGYECQLLCGWLSLFYMMKYTAANDKNALYANAAANVIGMALVPTFLYMLLAEMAFIGCLMVYERTIKWAYLRCQVISVTMVFLLYLPAFCFSGVTAFTENQYVTPLTGAYAHSIIDFSRYLINFCFSMLWGENNAINFVLFFFPLLLLLSKKKEQRLIGIFYAMLWIVYIILAFYMRRRPFARNMIIHLSLTMAFSVYTFYVITLTISTWIKDGAKRNVIWVCWAIPVLLFCRFLFISDRQNASMELYGQNANAIYEGHIADLVAIPRGSSISFSEESFYFFYLCRRSHFNVSRCPHGNEDFYIKRVNEHLPLNMVNKYKFVKFFTEDYDLYKRE